MVLKVVLAQPLLDLVTISEHHYVKAYALFHNTLVGAGLRDQVKIGASGKTISAF